MTLRAALSLATQNLRTNRNTASLSRNGARSLRLSQEGVPKIKVIGNSLIGKLLISKDEPESKGVRVNFLSDPQGSSILE